MAPLSRFEPDPESGQGLTEYGLIIVLAAIVVVLILSILGPAVGNLYSNIIAVI